MYRTFKLTVKVLFTLFLTGLFLYPFTHSRAFTQETITYSSSFRFQPKLEDYIDDFVDVPEGGVSWDPFAATKSIEYEITDEDGYEIVGVRPEFTEELKKLDGQTVLMQGYMFPLGGEEGQTMFLFGPFPVSCPFHYHAGPNFIIEAHSRDEVKFDWDAIDIAGRLELVPRDDEYNVFYRLHDVELAK